MRVSDKALTVEVTERPQDDMLTEDAYSKTVVCGDVACIPGIIWLIIAWDVSRLEPDPWVVDRSVHDTTSGRPRASYDHGPDMIASS